MDIFYCSPGQVLNALNLPVHAEAWLRQGCKLDKNDKEMPLLFQNIRVKRLYGPLTDGTKVKYVATSGAPFVHYFGHEVHEGVGEALE